MGMHDRDASQSAVPRRTTDGMVRNESERPRCCSGQGLSPYPSGYRSAGPFSMFSKRISAYMLPTAQSGIRTGHGKSVQRLSERKTEGLAGGDQAFLIHDPAGEDRTGNINKM